MNEELIKEIEKLSEAEQAKVLAYVRQLARFAANSQEEKQSGERTPGTLKGMFTMSDDFDEPLEDFKDYM